MMSQDLSTLVQKGVKFRICVGGKPVSRAEIETADLSPKPILKGGAEYRLWTIDLDETSTDGNQVGLCTMRCSGASVGVRDGLLWAFIEGTEPTQWGIQPGQNVDGTSGWNISLNASGVAWRDPGQGEEQIFLAESIIPEYRFTLEPVFEKE